MKGIEQIFRMRTVGLEKHQRFISEGAQQHFVSLSLGTSRNYISSENIIVSYFSGHGTIFFKSRMNCLQLVNTIKFCSIVVIDADDEY